MSKTKKATVKKDETLRLVLSGHVDHGKSTLIGRLFYDTGSLPEGKIEEIKSICDSLGKPLEFGYVMDHLAEERDQGITIDTAQTFFQTADREYNIIDAPGHVEFVKNMITGASQAEAAILIVDAQEGVQEQTRRHAYILSMLGLNQVIVVINKMDLVDWQEKRFKEVIKELGSFLKEVNIKPKHIIPISAQKGDNIAKPSKNLAWFKGPTVLKALDAFSVKRSPTDQPLRLPIQDVYKFDQRIIAGRLASGVIKKGQEITILPSKEKTTVTELKEFKKQPEFAQAGQSIGLTTKDPVFVDRGNIITGTKDLPEVKKEVKAHVFYMDPEPMEKGERLLFKLASQEVMAEVKEFTRVIDSSNLKVIGKKADKIENRQVADVVIELEKPIVVGDFNLVPEMGRFVLERSDTIAGGIITNK